MLYVYFIHHTCLLISNCKKETKMQASSCYNVLWNQFAFGQFVLNELMGLICFHKNIFTGTLRLLWVKGSSCKSKSIKPLNIHTGLRFDEKSNPYGCRLIFRNTVCFFGLLFDIILLMMEASASSLTFL